MSLEINNEIIEDELIDEELNYAIKDLGRIPSPEEQENILQSVKERLIYKTLLRQEAEKSSIIIPSKAIDKEYQIFFAEKTAPVDGEDEKQIKKYIENKLKESQLIDEICQDLKPPQIFHIRKFYEDNLEHYFIGKEFQYFEIGFHYPTPSHQSPIHDILFYVRKEISSQSAEIKFLDIVDGNQFLNELLITQPYWKEYKPYLFSKIWKSDIRKLNRKGLVFLEDLAQKKVSQVTGYSGESLLFTPVNTYPTQKKHYLGLFIHIQIRNNFTPSFEEIIDKVRADLWEELRQIKIKTHLRQLMLKSNIRDISYI